MYLDFSAARSLLETYGVDVEKTELAENATQARNAADKVGFPCVAKLNSAAHKTDIGGVIKNLENHAQVEEAFNQLEKNAKKHSVEFKGVLLQKMLSGKEIIIGGKQDPQFGGVVLFGLGGIFTEVMKDISLKIAPVTKQEAHEMIKSIKGAPVLLGARGEAPVDLEKLADTIVGVSKLISEHPEIKELDLNPMFVSDKHCRAVDLRIIC